MPIIGSGQPSPYSHIIEGQTSVERIALLAIVLVRSLRTNYAVPEKLLALIQAVDEWEVQDAAQERQVEEGHQQQHQEAEARGLSSEAGGSYRDVEGGEVSPQAKALAEDLQRARQT